MADKLGDTPCPEPEGGPSAIPDKLDTGVFPYLGADLIDSIDLPIILVDRNITIASFNAAAAKVLSLTNLQVGRPVRSIPMFGNAIELDERCASAIEDGMSYQREMRDENRSWFILRIMSYRARNQVTLAVLTLTNVTALRASLEQAVHEREHTKAIINNLIDPVVVLDDDHRIQTANQSFYTLFRLTRDQTQGIRLYELSKDHWDAVQLTGFLKQVQSDNPPDPLDCILQIPEVGRRSVMLKARRLSVEGRPRILLTIHDITRQKQAEETQARLASIVNSSDDAIISKTLEGIITSWNPAAEKIFGYTATEAIGQHITLIIPEDRLAEEDNVIARLRRGETIDHFETVRQTKDGRKIDISLAVSPIKHSDGRITGASKVSRDITQQKRMEEEILHANKMESVGILAGGIAHDFNNILTVIIGNLSIGKIYLGPEHKAFQNINESQKAALRAQGITQQLITFSKGGAPLKKIMNIGPQIAGWIKFALQGSNVGHDLSIPDDLWAVEADEGQIHQAINNIILNAQQAMPGGGNIQIQVSNFGSDSKGLSLPPGNYVRIQVKDQGTGIPPEKLPKVFDPFFTTKPNGTGLGLTSSYWITKRHGGHISIDSEVGTGTTVTMYLPMSAEKPLVKEVKDEKLIPGCGRILFMDDDESIRRLAVKLLTHLGYEVDCAEDGLEAIRLFSEARESGHPFDAVILDLTVRNGMGGKEAVRKLLEIDHNVRAIVSSGYSNNPTLADYKKFGFVGIIPKPYTCEKLSYVLSGVME